MTSVLFSERKSKLLEFESKAPKFDALVKTCIAFTNGSGGRFIIGVDDVSREIAGIPDSERTRTFDDFPNSLYDSTHPSLIAQIYEKNYAVHPVLIIEIPISHKKRYFLKSKGINKGAYVRVGSNAILATDECIEDLNCEAHRINFDEEIIRTNLDTLSKDLLHHYYGARVTKKRLLADKIHNNQYDLVQTLQQKLTEKQSITPRPL